MGQVLGAGINIGSGHFARGREAGRDGMEGVFAARMRWAGFPIWSGMTAWGIGRLGRVRTKIALWRTLMGPRVKPEGDTWG
jgi:hypothetical protein